MSTVKQDPSTTRPSTNEERIGKVLRTLRADRQLSVRTLAARADVSPSLLSQVENGLVSPSITSLERIATALGVSLGDVFQQTAVTPIAIVRRGDRHGLTSEWSQACIEALGPTGPGHRMEPLLVTLEPGGRSGPQPYAHQSDEFAMMFEGEVQLTLSESVHRMERGDAVTIPAGAAHRWENLTQSSAQILIVTAR